MWNSLLLWYSNGMICLVSTFNHNYSTTARRSTRKYCKIRSENKIKVDQPLMKKKLTIRLNSRFGRLRSVKGQLFDRLVNEKQQLLKNRYPHYTELAFCSFSMKSTIGHTFYVTTTPTLCPLPYVLYTSPTQLQRSCHDSHEYGSSNNKDATYWIMDYKQHAIYVCVFSPNFINLF